MLSLNGKRVLVTGADGFIGSHLTEKLVKEGANVRAMSLYNSFATAGWLDTLSDDVRGEIELVMGDVRDPYSTDNAIRDREVVFHLAALIAIPYSYVAPASYVDTNISGTLNVLQSSRQHGIERIVQTSTSEVYGTAQFVPITEEHPNVGQSPYSASKIASDQLAISYHRSFDTPVSVLRPFNTYGPRQSMRAVLPSVIVQLLAGKTELNLGALHPTRDFTFVTDTANGFMQIACCEDACGEVVNIGSNFEVPVGEAVEEIARLMDVDISINQDDSRLRPQKSEVERLYASTDKARRLFGWDPEFGGHEGFKHGLAKTIEWFSDPANRAFYQEKGYVI